MFFLGSRRFFKGIPRYLPENVMQKQIFCKKKKSDMFQNILGVSNKLNCQSLRGEGGWRRLVYFERNGASTIYVVVVR